MSLARKTAAAVAAIVLASGATAAASPPVAVSPQPGTPDASPRTQISFLGAPSSTLGRVSVDGSRSGRHGGHILAYSSATGASFVPDRPFAAGERVTVRASGLRLRFSFRVGRPARVVAPYRPPPADLNGGSSFVSRPDLRPPKLAVSGAAPGDGDIFVAPFFIPLRRPHMLGEYGPAIYDPRGSLVWTQTLPQTELAMNFSAQTYEGRPVLTWWHGQVSTIGVGYGAGTILDDSYRPVATVRAGNGYHEDFHELQVTPAGAAWIDAFDPVRTDLRAVGGPRTGTLLDSVVQEIDVKTGLVMFEWHMLGHVGLDESYQGYGRPWDAYHLNSIDVERGGDVLISARNTWAAYEVDTRSGRIVWRLGGRRSSFAMGRGTRFTWQHDARSHGGGLISLFDNGTTLPARAPARGLLLRLDMRRRSARLVRQYRHPQPLYVPSAGDTQLLPGGDVFEAWGTTPYLSEFSHAGKLVFDARFRGYVDTYRAFRLPWSGHPADEPAAAARAAGAATTVYASWNGATNVATWEVLAGPDAQHLAPAASAARAGFETAIAVASGGPVFEVEALDASGNAIGTSAPVSR